MEAPARPARRALDYNRASERGSRARGAQAAEEMELSTAQGVEAKAETQLWGPLSVKQLKHLVAGGVAGAVSRTCVSPLERMKILYQVQVERHQEHRRFRGILPSLVQIGREEGLRGYFKGNGTNVVRIMPYLAVQFAAYEEFKKLLHIPADPRQQRPLRRLCAGAMAGITSVTATYPLDLVRTRLSVQGEGSDRKYKNIRHAFRTILREEGGVWSGCLYRGLFPTILGIAPYVGLNFAIYESLKGHVLSRLLSVDDQRDQVVVDNELPVRWKLSCGAISGATAQSVSYPLDVIRRRMQMKGTMGDRFPYRGTAHAIATIVRTEGVPGLYKGMLPNLLKVAPSVAVAFVTYEFAKARLYGVPMVWR